MNKQQIRQLNSALEEIIEFRGYDEDEDGQGFLRGYLIPGVTGISAGYATSAIQRAVPRAYGVTDDFGNRIAAPGMYKRAFKDPKGMAIATGQVMAGDYRKAKKWLEGAYSRAKGLYSGAKGLITKRFSSTSRITELNEQLRDVIEFYAAEDYL